MDPKDLVGATAVVDTATSSEDIQITREQIEESIPPMVNERPAPTATIVPDPEPAPADPEDVAPEVGSAPKVVETRQAWVCVTPEGPRTRRNGVECPVFYSDNHIVGHVDERGYPQPPTLVICPNCGSKSVRMVGSEVKLNENGRAIPQ